MFWNEIFLQSNSRIVSNDPLSVRTKLNTNNGTCAHSIKARSALQPRNKYGVAATHSNISNKNVNIRITKSNTSKDSD